MKYLGIIIMYFTLLIGEQWLSHYFSFMYYIHIPLIFFLLTALSYKDISSVLLAVTYIIIENEYSYFSLPTLLCIWALTYICFYIISRYFFSDKSFISLFLLSVTVCISYFIIFIIATQIRTLLLSDVITPSLQFTNFIQFGITSLISASISTTVFIILLKMFKNLNPVFLR